MQDTLGTAAPPGATATAPGRLCLLGEHCDWAGGSSLVVPMDRGVRVTATPATTSSAVSVLEGRELRWAEGEDPGALFLVPAVLDALSRFRGERCAAAVHITSDLPAGRGFSSSAALTTAAVRALSGLYGDSLSPGEVAEVAYRAEHDIAGVACGRLDPLACAYGLPLGLRFANTNDEPPEVTPLPAHLDLAVGAFRAPRDTHTILDTLALHHRGDVPLRDWEAIRRVGAVRAAIEGFAAQAEHGRSALIGGDLRALGGAMDTCQEIYEEDLMGSFPALRAPGLVRAVRALRAAGAWGAKFSGAGGDGSVIGLYPPGGGVDRGVRALDALGLDAFIVEVWCTV